MTATAPKLKVWRTAIETNKVVLQNLGFLARAGLVWLLLAVVLLTGLDWLSARHGNKSSDSMLTPADIANYIAQSLVQAACLAAFAVAWHRRILHSPIAAQAQTMPLILHYGLVAFILDAIFTLSFSLPLLGSSDDPSVIKVVAFIAILLLAIYLWCRAMLVLPAIAIGADSSFATAWQATRGNGWRLVTSSILTALLPIIGYMLFIAAYPFLTTSSEQIATSIDKPATWDRVEALLSNAFVVIFAVIGIAFLSFAYRELVLKRAEAPNP